MSRTLVLAYPGSGKTYTATHYAGVVDFEHQDFMWIYPAEVAGLPLDERRSNMHLRAQNPAWPGNYLGEMEKGLAAGNILISPFIETVFKAADSYVSDDVRKILVIPAVENFDEIEARFIARNTGAEFIERRRAELPMLREIFDAAEGWEKIVLGRGQFLDDALLQLDVELKEVKNA
ncbi:MAG: hypothetical protein FWD15_06155 [Alphaproteobacteria bacterium]|nr:hypothetical protein [Alphaproteobacteria bacterium]